MFFPVNFKSLSILVVMIWVPLQCQGLVIPNATEDVTSDTTKSLGLVQFEEQKGFLKIEEKIEKVGHKSEEFNVPSMIVEGSNHLEVTLNVPESLEFEIYPHAKIYPLSSSKKLKNIRNMFLTDSKDHQGFIEEGTTKTSEYPKEKRKNFSRRKIPLKKKKASEEKTYCEPTKTTPVVIYQDTDAPPEDVLPRYILRSGVSPIVQDESTMSSPDLDEEIKLNLDSLVMGRLSPIENKPPLYLNTFRVGSANLDDLRVVPEINAEEKYDTGDNFNREVSWSQALSLMNENENISMSEPSKFIWKNDENLQVWNDESDQSPQKETDSVALPNFGNKFNSVTGVIYLSKMEPSSDEVWRENNKLHSMIVDCWCALTHCILYKQLAAWLAGCVYTVRILNGQLRDVP
ncbi:unnamed protein product [Timema podura]|uniref:Uncharacterized protein n=1 Tax=Timema podura TaxID=61482 RepID=A0ABN7NGZ0_TIMPD|nr:unnamed protein product [Timema podura]